MEISNLVQRCIILGIALMVATATITSLVYAIEPNKSDVKLFGHYEVKNTGELSYKNITTVTNLSFNIEDKTSSDFPDRREVLIVYFKEMPGSIDKFASTYDITPVFIKDDIKMAAFESSPKKDEGKTSEKTLKAIEKVSKDPRVELVKRDTNMFVDKETKIDMTPIVSYPEDYDLRGAKYQPNQVIVGFWRLPSSLEDFGAKYGGKPINVTQAGLSIQRVTYETKDMKGFIDRASKDPNVKYIVLNEILENIADAAPTEPYWDPGSTYYSYTWGQRRINLPQAWDDQTGSDNIIVALLDSGVQLDHPDLTGRFTTDRWDFINNDNDPTDDYGHGTKMAGIISENRDNGIGYAGVSQSKIMPIKVLDNSGDTPSFDVIINGIDYAINHNAKIISMSFSTTVDDPGLRAKIEDAWDAGCLLVASVGNMGSNTVRYPAGYDNVIGVSALDQSNQRYYLSSYGSTVDLSAPGISIGTTAMGSTYTDYQGTSPATAMVAGVAALVWSQNPTTLRDRIVTYLINSADDVDSNGRDDTYGYGRVNAYGAVAYGKMLAAGSEYMSGDRIGLMLGVPADTVVHVIMAGNENADFDIFLKWNSEASWDNYDVRSDSSFCFEHAITKGSGTLYIAIYSYSGTGSLKLWAIAGIPTDGGIIYGDLQQGTGSYSSGQRWGKGYAFNSGPDGCNFDLVIKWNAMAWPTEYDAIGDTSAPQEFAGPVYGTGTLYGMTYSPYGTGEFVMMRAVY